jgi:2-dehydro-3-deoxygluconokinase
VCDIALVTFDDEQALWLDNSPEETLNRLKRSGVKEAVVKLGVEGCLYQHFAAMETPVLAPTKAVETVVDTTSAGDSFNAGFLAGYLTGQSAQASFIQGHQLAGAVIQHKGAVILRSATDTATEQFSSNR